MERGVEGGEARIKLYSKLKKIERRRFSVDVLARDRGEEPDNVNTQDRFGTEEDEAKEDDESQNTFGSTRLPSEDDDEEDDGDTDMERSSEAIVESDISGLQSVTEPNTRSETAEADRRAGKEMLQREEEDHQREDGDEGRINLNKVERKVEEKEDLKDKLSASNEDQVNEEKQCEEKQSEEDMGEGRETIMKEENQGLDLEKGGQNKGTQENEKNEMKKKERRKENKSSKTREEKTKKDKSKGKAVSGNGRRLDPDQAEEKVKKVKAAKFAKKGKVDNLTSKENSKEDETNKVENGMEERQSEKDEEESLRDKSETEKEPIQDKRESDSEDTNEKEDTVTEHDGKDRDRESAVSNSSVKTAGGETRAGISDEEQSVPSAENEEDKNVEEDAKIKEQEDSDFDENNFSDNDVPLEGDLHLSDASITEDDIAVSNPDVLDHFGDKIVKSPVPETEEKNEPSSDGDGRILRAVTFEDTVNQIVSRLNTKAVIEEARREEKPREFAGFNWKPNVTFFQFGEEEEMEGAKVETGSSSEGAKVFSFAGGPPAPPFPVKKRRGVSLPRRLGGFPLGGGGGSSSSRSTRGWERLRRLSGRERGRRRDRSL